MCVMLSRTANHLVNKAVLWMTTGCAEKASACRASPSDRDRFCGKLRVVLTGRYPLLNTELVIGLDLCYIPWFMWCNIYKRATSMHVLYSPTASPTALRHGAERTRLSSLHAHLRRATPVLQSVESRTKQQQHQQQNVLSHPPVPTLLLLPPLRPRPALLPTLRPLRSPLPPRLHPDLLPPRPQTAPFAPGLGHSPAIHRYPHSRLTPKLRGRRQKAGRVLGLSPQYPCRCAAGGNRLVRRVPEGPERKPLRE